MRQYHPVIHDNEKPLLLAATEDWLDTDRFSHAQVQDTKAIFQRVFLSEDEAAQQQLKGMPLKDALIMQEQSPNETDQMTRYAMVVSPDETLCWFKLTTPFAIVQFCQPKSITFQEFLMMEEASSRWRCEEEDHPEEEDIIPYDSE